MTVSRNGPRAETTMTRRALVGAGAAAAGGVAVLGLPDVVAAAGAQTRVGSAPTDRRGIGFVVQVDQDGPSLAGFGYLTRVLGLTASDLFTAAPATNSSDPRASDPSKARLTFEASGNVESIDKLGDEITAVGPFGLRVYFQAYGGATFDDPGSFAKGTEVAVFGGTFQNGLSITEPSHADVNLIADLTQSSAARFSDQNRQLELGRKGTPWALQGRGRGVLNDPSTPKSRLLLTGSFGVVDAVRH